MPWLAHAGRRGSVTRREERMSSRRLRFMLPAALVLGLIGASIAIASGGDDGKSSSSATHFTASLNGHNEVPAVHSSGKGTLSLTINADNTMSFTLTYSNL